MRKEGQSIWEVDKEQAKAFALLLFYFSMFTFIGFCYLGIVLVVEEKTHGIWNMAFFFAALWMPIRLDGYLPKQWLRASWADKNEIELT